MYDLQKNAAIVLMALLLSFSVAQAANIPISIRHVAIEENVPQPTGPPSWPDLSVLSTVVYNSKYDHLDDRGRNLGMRMNL